MDWLVDSAQVLTAAFTASAAYAALKSVRQGQEIWRASQQADLHVQVLHNVSSGNTDLALINAGGGVARGVAFIVGSATERAGGTIHDGFIGSSMKTYIRTEVRYLKPVECVVMFRDVDESAWVIGRVGPKRPLATPTVLDAEWDAAHPDMPWDQSADGFRAGALETFGR